MTTTIGKIIDCSTPLNLQQALGIKAAGYIGVGRYLGAKTHGWSKAITPDEVSVLKQAELMIVGIWEGDPTAASYFTYAQGVKDATEALTEVQALGQPTGSAIYFTVDYDAQDADMEAIRTYLSGVYKILHPAGYATGVYGSKRVMDNVTADCYWQTAAWSGGLVSTRACMFQHASGIVVSGVSVDVDDVYSGPGWWNQPHASQTPVQAPQVPQNTIANDVSSDAWYADAVAYALSPSGGGILTKDANGNFNPDQTVTRAMLAEVLYKLTHQK